VAFYNLIDNSLQFNFTFEETAEYFHFQHFVIFSNGASLSINLFIYNTSTTIIFAGQTIDLLPEVLHFVIYIYFILKFVYLFFVDYENYLDRQIMAV